MIRWLSFDMIANFWKAPKHHGVVSEYFVLVTPVPVCYRECMVKVQQSNQHLCSALMRLLWLSLYCQAAVRLDLLKDAVDRVGYFVLRGGRMRAFSQRVAKRLPEMVHRGYPTPPFTCRGKCHAHHGDPRVRATGPSSHAAKGMQPSEPT